MKLAVPGSDHQLLGFPVIAAAELGFFRKEGPDICVELIAPAGRTYESAA